MYVSSNKRDLLFLRESNSKFNLQEKTISQDLNPAHIKIITFNTKGNKLLVIFNVYGIKMKINCWRMSYFEYWGGGGDGLLFSGRQFYDRHFYPGLSFSLLSLPFSKQDTKK